MAYNKSEQFRETLVNVSKKLFLENGFEKTTMRQIAKECGVNQALAYYYHANKASLALEIFSEYMSQFENTLSTYVSEEKSPVLFLLLRARLVIRELQGNPQALDFYSGTYGNLPAHRPFTDRIHNAAKIHLNNEDISLSSAKIAMTAGDGIWESLTRKKRAGEIEIDENEIQDLSDIMRFTYLGLEYAEVKKLIKTSNTMLLDIPLLNINFDT